MTWKRLNNGLFGRRNTFGGEDIDKISKVFDGTEEVDNVDINSSTTVRSNKLRFKNPANTFSYTITPSAIAANRTVTMPQLTTGDTFLFQNEAQTVKHKAFANCEFDATLAPISKFAIDPSIMRWGSIFPLNAAHSTTAVAAREGILSRHTLRNPNGTPEGDWMEPGELYGYNGQFFRLENTSSEGDWCGVVSPTTGTGLFRMSHDGMIRVRWQQEDADFASFWCGISSSTSAPLDDADPLGNNESGIIMGNSRDRGGANGIEVVYHEGDGGPAHRSLVASGTSLSIDNESFNDLQIKWWNNDIGLHASASVKSAIKGATLYTMNLGTNTLPAPTTDLFFHCHLINTGSDSQALGIGGIWVESI